MKLLGAGYAQKFYNFSEEKKRQHDSYTIYVIISLGLWPHPPINLGQVLSSEEIWPGFACQMSYKKNFVFFKAFGFLDLAEKLWLCGDSIEGLSIINEDFGPSLIKPLQPIDQCPIDRTSSSIKGAENTWGLRKQGLLGPCFFFLAPGLPGARGMVSTEHLLREPVLTSCLPSPTGRSVAVSPLQVIVAKKPKRSIFLLSTAPACSPPSLLSHQTESLLRLCNPPALSDNQLQKTLFAGLLPFFLLNFLKPILERPDQMLAPS